MLIYFILNLVNEKIYIGQTRSTIKRRYSGNVFRTPANPHLKAAYHHYGENAFIWGPLRYCMNQEDLDYWERYYIQHYDSMNPKKGYNMEVGGFNRTGISEVARNTFRASQLRLCEDPKHREQLKERSLRYWSNVDNRREKSLQMKRTCNLPEKRLANSLRQGGRPFRVYKRDTNEFVGEWINKNDCARALNLDRRKITPCLKGERSSHKGYVFRWP